MEDIVDSSFVKRFYAISTWFLNESHGIILNHAELFDVCLTVGIKAPKPKS